MANEGPWHKSACILCSINCGIEVQLSGRQLSRIRGDRQHPASQGYTQYRLDKDSSVGEERVRRAMGSLG